MITVRDRAQAVTRAKQAITHLEAHPRTTMRNLGAARDQANIVQNCSSTHDVYDAVCGLEALVVEIYGHIPTREPGTPGDTSAGEAPAQLADLVDLNGEVSRQAGE